MENTGHSFISYFKRATSPLVVLRFLSDRGVYVSSGSACHKGKPSHVYAALGLQKKVLDGILRVSFSYDTTREDVDALVDGLAAAREQLFTSLS